MLINIHVVTARLHVKVKNTAICLIRAAKYMVISNVTGKRFKSVKQSAVSEHLPEYNCF